MNEYSYLEYGEQVSRWAGEQVSRVNCNKTIQTTIQQDCRASKPLDGIVSRDKQVVLNMYPIDP